MKKVIFSLCLIGCFTAISKVSYAGDEEIIAALNKSPLVLEIKAQISELQKKFIQNFDVYNKKVIENFRADLMIQRENQDYSVYNKYLKNPKEYIDGCKEVAKKIYKLTYDLEDYSKLSNVGKYNFIKSITSTTDPYYCSLGYAAGISGCGEFAQRLEFISGDEQLADSYLASCLSFVTIDLIICLNQQ